MHQTTKLAPIVMIQLKENFREHIYVTGVLKSMKDGKAIKMETIIKRTNQVKGITPQENGFLGCLIAEHMCGSPVFPTIKIRLSKQVKVTVDGLVFIIENRRCGHIGHPSGRGARKGSLSGGGAEAAENAGTATLEPGLRCGVLCRVLLNSH